MQTALTVHLKRKPLPWLLVLEHTALITYWNILEHSSFFHHAHMLFDACILNLK